MATEGNLRAFKQLIVEAVLVAHDAKELRLRSTFAKHFLLLFGKASTRSNSLHKHNEQLPIIRAPAEGESGVGFLLRLASVNGINMHRLRCMTETETFTAKYADVLFAWSGWPSQATRSAGDTRRGSDLLWASIQSANNAKNRRL